MKKSLAILLAFIMVFTAVGVQMPVTVEAATQVAFSCTNKTVAIGGTYTLTVQGVTDKKATYAWSSADMDVAKVSKSGVVTGVSAGSTTVKCKITMSDKSTKTLSCKVTVKEQIVATSVKISNAKLGTMNAHTIKVGDSYDFNRTLSPSNSNDKTYWYVLNEDYAEVDSSGVVTAKKEGMTILVAKSGIDRIEAESLTNTVIDYVILNLVAPSSAKPTVKPTATPKPLSDMEKISKADVGDYVTFGAYEQDNNIDNGAEAIEWQVLDKKNGKVLLLSKYALDVKSYHEKNVYVTWETCTLRSWLNEEFYKAAFTGAEQKYIAETYLMNKNHPNYGTSGGRYTYDKVFLLSMEEVTTYFDLDSDAIAQVTEYANAKGTGNTHYSKNGHWWLRSPGVDSNTAVLVNDRGYVYSAGYSVDNRNYVVRPALWVEIEASPTGESISTPHADSVFVQEMVQEIGEASVGDYVIFGTYEQDNNMANGAEAIEWQVLDKRNGKVLLLSKYALDTKPYHGKNVDVTWETCTLRSWLNEEFYKIAFTNVEQKYIAETYVVNEDNPMCGTKGGNDTYDNIFLLSIGEAMTYRERSLLAVDTTEYVNWLVIWWLRSPGFSSSHAACVDGLGSVHYEGCDVDYVYYVVRPALWVEVE